MKWAVPVWILLVISCTIPRTGVDGRSTDPGDEVLVIHSLAETVTSIAIDADGLPGTLDSDVAYLGAVANDIIRLRDRYLVTLSGENALVFLTDDTLSEAGRIELGRGRNPMESAVLSVGNGEEIIAVTEFLTGTVSLHRAGTTMPPTISELVVSTVGAAPQALIVLSGSTANERRVIVANTAFSLNSESGYPFGAASISVRTVEIDESGPAVTIGDTVEIPLEDADFDGTVENGLNPVAFLDIPATGELLILGSGRNYGDDLNGDDDGVVLVLDRETLDVLERIPVGGSPGAGALIERNGTYYLFLAGVRGIRRVHRDDTWSTGASPLYESSGTPLPFLSDIAIAGDYLYAADFSRSLVLVFFIKNNGTITEVRRIPVSQGPISLLVDRR